MQVQTGSARAYRLNDVYSLRRCGIAWINYLVAAHVKIEERRGGADT